MSIYTLALESSCDETSASVLKDGRTVLSNVISSQVPIHRKFGGVVPEIASRHHIEQVIPVIDQALRDANVTLQDIDQHWRYLWSRPCWCTVGRCSSSKGFILCYRYSFGASSPYGRSYFC